MNGSAAINPLADAAGFYREFQPPMALRGHFQCVWVNRAARDQGGPVDVVPDGCVDLVWREGRLLVAGPDITVARPVLMAGSTVLGARFRAGAAAHWLGLPMSEIVGRSVDLADIWGPRRVREVGERIADAPTPATKARWLLDGLSAMAPSMVKPDETAGRIFSWLHEGTGASDPVAALRERLDLSERTLLRRSREHFGYGPKMLDRILRFQRFQTMARRAPQANLAAMAAEAGFADQAHLNRDIQSLCGMSAGAFVRQLTG